MLRLFIFCSCLTLFLPSIGFSIDVKEWLLNQHQWPQYANGTNIFSLEQPKSVLSEFEESEGVRIVIQHAGGDGGKKWADTLRQWFIAYGVPSGYLSIEFGAEDANQLRILLIDKNQ